MKANGFTILAIVIGLCLLGLAAYLIKNRFSRPTSRAFVSPEIEAKMRESQVIEGQTTATAPESNTP
jgi:hypothetical protein